MTDNQTNPFLIPPPPPRQVEDHPPVDADENVVEPDRSTPLITLPPGLVDSATHRVGARATKRPDSGSAASRSEAPAAPVRRSADEIVFFPAPPGAAAPRTAARPAQTPPPTQPGTATPPASAARPAGAAVPSGASDATVVRPTGSVASWRLTLPSGETVSLAKTTFVGRNPSVMPAWPDADLLVVDDPAKSVSKTHALLEIAGARLWVHDLDSTNGVWLSVDGSDDMQVPPGQRVAVEPGMDLELGEFVIQVEHSGR